MHGWIEPLLRRLTTPDAMAWWLDARASVEREGLHALALGVGHAARRVGRAPLPADAAAPIPVGHWTTDQFARAGLLAALPAGDSARWLSDLDRWFATGTLEELVAAYQALPLLAHPALLAARAAEGVRSNMRPVFAAVAFDNPFPADHLAADAFRQMVLKVFFVQGDPDRILGLERRLDQALGRMLDDHIRERRLAGREVDAKEITLADRCRTLEPA